MFKYARKKNINKWLNNNIQLHFIMKHFNMAQWRVLCPHNHLLETATTTGDIRELSSPRVGISASYPVTVGWMAEENQGWWPANQGSREKWLWTECLRSCLDIGVCCVVAVRPWSDEEKLAVTKQLGHLVKRRRAPRKHECLAALEMEPVLAARDWRAVKHHAWSKIFYARLRDKNASMTD